MPPKKPTPARAKAGAAKGPAKPAAKTPAKKPAGKGAAAKSEVKPEAVAVEEKPKVLPGVSIGLKQLNAVLMTDEGGHIKESGRWPLIIDQEGVAGQFLKYRDVNYLQALDKENMAPDRIRLAVIGGIRFGKPLVLDLYNVDVFEATEKFFDEAHPGLMKMIMDKSILEEDNYKKLIKDTDDETYTTLYQYTDQCIENFRFWILTMKADPEKKLMEQVYPIRIE